jgi:hypothetical protein
MNTADELLKRALEAWEEYDGYEDVSVFEDIRAYLAAPRTEQDTAIYCRECLTYNGHQAGCSKYEPRTEQEPVAWRCCMPGQDPILLHDEPSDERYPPGYKDPLYYHPAPRTEQEPVMRQGRWKRKDWDYWVDWCELTKEKYEERKKELECGDWVYEVRELFTHPAPKRKPLSIDEIETGFGCSHNALYWIQFVRGVRWAEKMHKIGGDDDV